MKRILLFLSFIVLTSMLHAQYGRNAWKAVNLYSATKGKDPFQNNFKPKTSAAFQLDEIAMRGILKKAPSEKQVSSSKSSFIIFVPNSSGVLERFRIVEAPSFDAGLSAKFPEIKSYAGKGIDEPGSTIRFTISPMGFHAMVISSNRKTFYINKVDNENKVYLSYDRELDGSYKTGGFDCQVDAVVNSEFQGAAKEATSSFVGSAKSGGVNNLNATTNVLRTYRMVVPTTGEYSQGVLALVSPGTDTSTLAKKQAIVLSTLNQNVTDLNSILENEFNVRVQLIANETSVMYFDKNTDPWDTWTSSLNTSVWNTETQSTCTNVIGSANYDIGHMLNYNPVKNNGNAGCIGCVCSSNKGGGWTMYQSVSGLYYMIVDYWSHEVGHQLGANHVFTYSYEGTIAQVEPGSGSTIMSYAGITGATDLQAHNDNYFHAISIQQVTDYVQSGNGKTCGTTSSLTNNIPTANAGADYTIPKSTPFMLTGSYSDADASDVPSFCWEQYDKYVSGGTSNTYPTATSTTGPMFRSYYPVSGVTRTFPKLQLILDSNNAGKWEVLPSVARTMKFRFTVRDNHAGGSANNSDSMIVTVSSTTGPFAVTAPNTTANWGAGTTQTVTWSVNGTSGSPINCANVKISLSTDGGQTFPTVLAASTPNNGSATVTIPSGISSTTCRIKVEAIGNIFFDISNSNFSIGTCSDVSGLSSSSVTGTSATVSWTAASDATSYDVDYKLISSSTWINAATATTSTSANITGLTPGNTYDFRVKNNCPFNNGSYISSQFTTLCNTTPTGLSSSSVTGTDATISWTASSGASSYDVDYKLTSSGTWINAATATTSTSVNLTGLTVGSQYDWRVRANCSVGSTSYASDQFTTLCNTTPTGLSSSSVTGTDATISWTASSGATSYDVDYKLTSSGTWTNAASATTSTSVNLTGLTVGSQYDWRVRANCSVGSTSYASDQFTTACDIAPIGLSSTNITTSGATISWTGSASATSYDVDYKLTSSGTWTNAATATTSTSVDVSGLSPVSDYDWRVRANCTNGSSSYNSAQFTTATPPCNDPTGLSVSNITTTSATVSWSAVSGGNSYDVDYKESSSSTWISAATGVTGTSVDISGLSTVTIYDWRVVTNCTYGTSGYVSSQFTTAAPPCDGPSGLSASNLTSNSATISWSAVSGADNYDVDYKLTTSLTWINAATATTSTSVDISGLTASSVYDWRVRTNCAYGTSDYNAAQFTTNAAPCNTPIGLTVTNITDTSATLKWTPVSGANSYGINYKKSTSSTWIILSTAAPYANINVSGLSGSTSYDWRVRTNCPAGVKSDFDTGHFTTACPKPATFTTVNITDHSADLTWSPVPGAIGYNVQYKESDATMWRNAATGTTATTITISKLLAGTSYDWRVVTQCANGVSGYSKTSFVTLQPAPMCPGIYDTAYNNTFANATVIPENVDIAGTIDTVIDRDYYKFSLNTAGTVNITLTNLPKDYNIYFYDQSHTALDSSVNTGTNSELITANVSATTYFIQVFKPKTGTVDPDNCYTLRVNFGSSGRGSAESSFANTNKMQVFPNPTHTIINVKTGMVSAGSELRIVDAFGRTVILKTAEEGTTKINVAALAQGMYFVSLVDKDGNIKYKEKFMKY